MVHFVVQKTVFAASIQFLYARGRDERLELPVEAMREAIVNAIAHRDYRSTANVQVYIFHDRMEIVTPGGLPAGMCEEDLGIKSVPRNPLLFSMLHRMDLVEKIGSGIRRIRLLCVEHGIPEPGIEVSEHWVTTTFIRSAREGEDRVESRVEDQAGTMSGPSRDQVGDQVGTKSGPSRGPSRHQVEILRNSINDNMIIQLMKIVGRSNRTKFRNQVLKPMLEAGWLEMTILDKPTSRMQKYRLTTKGKAVLASLQK